MTYFSPEENTAWRKTLPTKSIGAKLLLHNSQQQFLIVKPNYKPGWQLVGGVVEKNESPLTAALREVKEEVSIDLALEQLRFAGVSYEPACGERNDGLLIIFSAELTDDQVANIVVQEEEIDDYKFVMFDELTDYARGHSPQVLKAVRQAGYGLAYTNSGQPELGVFITEEIIPPASSGKE